MGRGRFPNNPKSRQNWRRSSYSRPPRPWSRQQNTPTRPYRHDRATHLEDSDRGTNSPGIHHRGRSPARHDRTYRQSERRYNDYRRSRSPRRYENNSKEPIDAGEAGHRDRRHYDHRVQREAEDVRHHADGRDSHNSSERKQSSKRHDDTFVSRKSPDAT